MSLLLLRQFRTIASGVAAIGEGGRILGVDADCLIVVGDGAVNKVLIFGRRCRDC